MRSNIPKKLCLAPLMPIIIAFACVLAVCRPRMSQAEKPPDNKTNVNSLCYVCHIDLETEEITTVHLANGITCDKCHGPSANHMHDEMLMTKPDQLFGRAEVEAMCKTCHDPDQAHVDKAAMEAFRKKWLGRTRPNGRPIATDSVCTDCHGTHNIIKQMGTTSEKEQPEQWLAAFNGHNLAGWRTSGSASWTIERGCIKAAAGPAGKGGDLWAETLYDDYRLSVTFRATWPIHAGIWLRAAEEKQGPRVEIFESRKPPAFTGSIWLSGSGLLLVNLRADFLARDGWNTISAEVRGNRFAVWLNAEEVGAVRITGPAKGRIGFHIEPDPASKAAQLWVREVLVQPLGEPAQEVSKLSRN